MNLGMKHCELSFSSPDMLELLQYVLGKGLSFRFKANGFSMTPSIRDGDIITIAPCVSTILRSGDIAAFIHPGTVRLTVHRIIGIHEESFFIKGDNVNSGDGPIPKSKILGHVVRIERNGQNKRLGLGAERRALAFLSRCRIVPFLRVLMQKLHRLCLSKPSE
jgi:signal peptidase I